MNVGIRKLQRLHGENQTEFVDPMPSLEFAKAKLAEHVASVENDPYVFSLKATEYGLEFETVTQKVWWSIVPLESK